MTSPDPPFRPIGPLEGRTDVVATAGRVLQTSKPPLYFQHQGHSRTIVGAQRRMRENSGGGRGGGGGGSGGRGGSWNDHERFLLIFDPSLRIAEIRSATDLTRILEAGNRAPPWCRYFKRSLGTLRQCEFELIRADPSSVLSELERQAAKDVHRRVIEDDLTVARRQAGWD
uniref:Uncharacterized protein n=1 Tax=Chromera velia CCMP2878 TaxID=1169474 RepID=A0A0G4FGA4_9ALVE|eukprot:Cvel_16766.t1-p1 / transcript=Cvel_16766.t1 / gene=Cvel_16766 / organism=Chromera_velia_CCMP2878 / gene_product=Zinc finger with UFM1-specific peptidase domain, putative / transcript_product=Zinc finger with UFM1-specific peptidase domain, putative / location=Cvel_scaffold1307:41175-41684(+) / protein_length=170 / sequence_SO=supercontig / SO=protein_coding / is_pseudo=false